MNIDFFIKISQAYSNFCKPLCHELGLPQTAFDILMFLANNPQYKTAGDVVAVRKLKANLVSVNVEKLVNDGYLKREEVKNDRRKTNLYCTEKAQPIIKRGRDLQSEFFEMFFRNVGEEEKACFFATVEKMNDNLEKALEEK